MEFEDELEIAVDCFADEYEITKKQAENIISDFNLEDEVIERYNETIKDAEKTKREEWQEEMTQPPYTGDIHGGI